MALCSTSAAFSSLIKREWASEHQGDWLVVTQQAWDGDGTHSHQFYLALDRGFGHWIQDKASSEASLGQGQQRGVRLCPLRREQTVQQLNGSKHSLALNNSSHLGAQLCSSSIATRRHFWHLERSIYTFLWMPLAHLGAFSIGIMLEEVLLLC